MKKRMLSSAVIAAVLWLTGCAGISASTEESAVPEPRAGEQMIKALIQNDAEAFLAQFPKEGAADFSVNDFKKTRESMIRQIGEPVSYEFLVNLKHPKFTFSIWLIHCERKSSDGQKTIQQDVLLRVVSGKMDGTEQLLQFQFL